MRAGFGAPKVMRVSLAPNFTARRSTVSPLRSSDASDAPNSNARSSGTSRPSANVSVFGCSAACSGTPRLSRKRNPTSALSTPTRSVCVAGSNTRTSDEREGS